MFLASKIGWARIALTLLTTGMSLQALPRSAAGSDSNNEKVAAFVVKNEIRKMQEILRDKGHYRGKTDGVLGLRSRASIRAYQKARICQSPARSIARLQTDSGSDLNRPGAIPKVPSGMFSTVATGLAARSREINLPQVSGGLSVEQAMFRGRKSQGLLLSKTTAEKALTNDKLRTRDTTGN